MKKVLIGYGYSNWRKQFISYKYRSPIFFPVILNKRSIIQEKKYGLPPRDRKLKITIEEID